MGQTYGEERPDGLWIKLKLSQEEWGDLVGATRESINRQFRTWSKDGLIDIAEGYVVLKQPGEIDRLAGFDSA
jgi:CRP/FNR family transcriptional regulator